MRRANIDQHVGFCHFENGAIEEMELVLRWGRRAEPQSITPDRGGEWTQAQEEQPRESEETGGRRDEAEKPAKTNEIGWKHDALHCRRRGIDTSKRMGKI